MGFPFHNSSLFPRFSCFTLHQWQNHLPFFSGHSSALWFPRVAFYVRQGKVRLFSPLFPPINLSLHYSQTSYPIFWPFVSSILPSGCVRVGFYLRRSSVGLFWVLYPPSCSVFFISGKERLGYFSLLVLTFPVISLSLHISLFFSFFFLFNHSAGMWRDGFLW